MKSENFILFATFVSAQPGSMTSLLHFGDIIEKNILTIINNPNRKLEFLINHENLYRFGFNYCDAGKFQPDLEKDQMCEVTEYRRKFRSQ